MNTPSVLSIGVVSTILMATVLSSPPVQTKALNYTGSSAYTRFLLPEAQRIQQKWGIPSSITIAIARHETGDGRAVIGIGNHWGLKRVTGATATHLTTECFNGKCGKLKQGFQTCPDIKLCGDIFGRTVINMLGRDRGLLQSNPTAALNKIGRKYATDPSWSQKVNRIYSETRKVLK